MLNYISSTLVEHMADLDQIEAARVEHIEAARVD
jgi:hypothetical protein